MWDEVRAMMVERNTRSTALIPIFASRMSAPPPPLDKEVDDRFSQSSLSHERRPPLVDHHVTPRFATGGLVTCLNYYCAGL